MKSLNSLILIQIFMGLLCFQQSAFAQSKGPLCHELFETVPQDFEAKLVIAQIQRELELPKSLKTRIKLRKQSDLPGYFSKDDSAPLFHIIAPRFFDKDFKPHNPQSWEKLRQSKATVMHFRELMAFLSLSETEFAADYKSVPRGKELLNFVQSEIRDIAISKMDPMSAPAQQSFIEVALTVLQANRLNVARVATLAHHFYYFKFKSEALVAELIEVRKEIMASSTAYKLTAYDHENAIYHVEKTIIELTRQLDHKSEFFQAYLSNINPSELITAMLLPTTQKYTHEINEKLFEEYENTKDQTTRMKIGTYFLSINFYKPDILSQFKSDLSEAQKDPIKNKSLINQLNTIIEKYR